MIRFNVSVGITAVAVSLLSVFAPISAETAFAQQVERAPEVQHIQLPADEIVPEFISKAVIQPVPAANEQVKTTAERPGSLRELVSSIHGESNLDEQLKCLAGAVYFEARGEPLAGQLAVAEVVINRAASGRFPASYCGVVLQKSQFSFVKRGRMPSLPGDSVTWQRAKAIAQIAHRKMWDSEAEGSLYFHARYVSPGWSNRRQAMARISNHVFYR